MDDHMKQQSGGSSSSSSLADNLFGPKDASSSSGLFSSVFGSSSMGLGSDSSHSKNIGLPKKQEYGGPYGTAKPSTQDYKTQRNMSEKDGNHIYQNVTGEPTYLSSSIHYGGQEVYISPNTHTTRPRHTHKKDGGDDDPHGGNWWQGSLYY